MGTVVGPGVRIVVFMSGCPLRCIYCHNPDTWDMGGGKEMSAQEVFEKIYRLRSYFGKDGGVTASGGEPLMQYDFALSLLKLSKEQNLHTAIETSGFTVRDLTELNQYTDLWLYDIKLFPEDEHLKHTGVSNKKILIFAIVQLAHWWVGWAITYLKALT